MYDPFTEKPTFTYGGDPAAAKHATVCLGVTTADTSTSDGAGAPRTLAARSADARTCWVAIEQFADSVFSGDLWNPQELRPAAKASTAATRDTTDIHRKANVATPS